MTKIKETFSRWSKLFTKDGKEIHPNVNKKTKDMRANFAPPLTRHQVIQQLIETGEIRRVMKNAQYMEQLLDEENDWSVHDPEGLASLYEDKIKPHLKKRHKNEQPVPQQRAPNKGAEQPPEGPEGKSPAGGGEST